MYGQELQSAQKAAVKKFAKHQGLIFFYKGKSKLEQTEAQIVANFAKEYHMPILGVSMDGILFDSIPSKVNKNQAANLGIISFPALLLYDNETNSAQPVAYGFATIDQIEANIFAIRKDFTDLESVEV